MDVFEAIRTVLAVRSYRPDPVPPDVVARIVEAGRLTASSMNRQPWHFVVVEDKAMLQQLAGLAKTGPYIAEAPLAIVVAVEKESRFGVSDGSRAIQSMVLAAWAEGVGSNWVGFRGLEEIRALLHIPAEYEILAVLPFGYPAQPAGQGKKKRKPLAEVVSRGRYGAAFADSSPVQ
jgi:nitroreductase